VESSGEKNEKKPLIFVISGPTGVGKTTQCRNLISRFSGKISAAITATTRLPRPGEINGVDYYFFSQEEFLKNIDAGKFLEHSAVHGEHLYGITCEEVDRHLAVGRDVLLNMSVGGALYIQKLAGEKNSKLLHQRVVTIFLLPPPIDELMCRIQMRGSMDEKEVIRRQKTMQHEMAMVSFYNYSIPPASREETFEQICHIYVAEKMRNRSGDFF
jgi:guanylate kinase